MDQLFGSKTRVKLLGLFFKNPNRSYYVREITRKIDEQINSVRRELANLLSIGIVKSENRENRLYYEVNQDYENYEALRALFSGDQIVNDESETVTEKSTQAGGEMGSTIKGLGAVDLLIYMGSFTQDTITGIDVLVVGDVNKTQVHNFIADLEDEEGREIKYAVMPTHEFKYRRDVNDRFITMVDSARKTIIHDPHGLMPEAANSKKKTAKKGK